MIKRSIISLLCLLLLLGDFGALTSGKAAEEETTSSSPQIITWTWLKEQTGKDEQWLQEQVDKGFTLYEIYRAVEEGHTESSLATSQAPQRVTETVAEEPPVLVDTIPAKEPAAADGTTADTLPANETDGTDGTEGTAADSRQSTDDVSAVDTVSNEESNGVTHGSPNTDAADSGAMNQDGDHTVQADVYGIDGGMKLPGVGNISSLMASVLADVYGPYDGSAIAQAVLADDASRYIKSYGDNGVSVTEGNLVVQATDFVLQGSLPFPLTRVYDSAKSNDLMGASLDTETGMYRNVLTPRREEAAALGRGWSWNLPSIEEHAGQKYLSMPGVGTYALTDTMELQGYAWNNLKVSSTSGEAVNGVSSKYLIRQLNGPQYYLDQEGYLILITDHYGNRVEFSYVGSGTDKRISRIRNNDGRELVFSYGSNQLSIQETGTQRQYTYRQRGDGEEHVLSEVLDPLSRSTRYAYQFSTSPFNVVTAADGSMGDAGANTAALLTRIVRPTSAMTDFRYEAAEKRIGVYGTAHIFKVNSRVDLYSTTAGDRKLRDVKLSYSGEDLTSYGQNASWKTTVNEARLTETYEWDKTFVAANAPNRLYLSDYRHQGGTTGYQASYSYDLEREWNLPAQKSESYSENGNPGSLLTTTYTYNEHGLPLSQTLSTGQQTTYQYATSRDSSIFWVLPQQVSTKISGTQNAVEIYDYDLQGSVRSAQVREGSAGGKLLSDIRINYDRQGHPTSRTVQMDAENQQSMVAWMDYKSPYGSYLLTSESLPRNVKNNYDYYPTGELKSKSDASGRVESYVYDAVGRLTQTTHSDGTQTSITYNDATNDITLVGPDGIPGTLFYNPFGQLVQQQTADAVYRYGYDEEGNVIESSDAERAVTRYSYDALGRNIRTSYPDGTSDTTAYDAAQRTVTYTDPAGNRQRQSMDVLGRVTSIQEERDGSFQPLQSYAYNLAGMTTSTTDGNAQTTSYAYDARGQMTSVTDPMGQTTQYTYTIGGNLMLVKYPDGQQNYYQYDELGRRTLLQKASGSQTTNTYDVRGNVTQIMTGKSEAIRFEYNNDDLITKWSGPDFSTSYTYDRVGRRLTMTDAHGTTAYSYQPDNGFLSTLTYPDGTSIRYTYNTQSRTGYTVTSSSGEETNVTAALDRMSRVTELDVNNGSGGAGLQSVGTTGSLDTMTFDYTPNSLIKSQSSANGLSTSFQYKGNDLTGMAVSQSGTPLQQFGYEWDGSKNITSITNNSTTDTFGYDALNRIGTETQGDESRGYSYDANGNRASMGSGKLFGLKNAEYTYDSLSRLTKAAGEGIEVGYSYNGDGLLYERTSAGKTTRYYYDEEAKLIAEAEVVGGTPKMTYVYIYDLSGRIWARKDLATDQLQYFHLNGHGDVVGLSDSSGKTLNQYSYDIWGGPLTAEETVPNVLRYAGEYWDDTTGLQYLRARWYDPSMGRFMGEDTYQGEIANPLTLNWYTYVSNNPLKYVDPSGHMHQAGSGSGGYYYSVATHKDTLSIVQVRGAGNQAQNQLLGQLAAQHQRSMFGQAYNGEMTLNQFKYLFGLATNQNNPGTAKWALRELDYFFVNGWDQKLMAAAEGYGLAGSGAVLGGNGSSKGKVSTISTQRVGQWMSKAEYEDFVKVGTIPRTNVLTKGKEGYERQANKGDLYVEFDIDSSILMTKDAELGWSLVKSKNQMQIKLAEKKGQTLPAPIGTNIKIIDTKK